MRWLTLPASWRAAISPWAWITARIWSRMCDCARSSWPSSSLRRAGMVVSSLPWATSADTRTASASGRSTIARSSSHRPAQSEAAASSPTRATSSSSERACAVSRSRGTITPSAKRRSLLPMRSGA